MSRTRQGQARPSGRDTALGTAAACCGLVLAALPVFLVGGLAVQVREELGFTETALGAAVSIALFTAAAASPVTGRAADRFGARTAIAAGSACSVLASVGIAATAQTWMQLTGLLALAGVGVALMDPGLAILLTRAVPSHRQGLAFGVKEAAIPVATLAAGVAVPAVALTVGWRWAFAVAVVPLTGLAVLLARVELAERMPSRDQHRAGSGDDGPAGDPAGDEPVRPGGLVLVAVATALGMLAASGVGVFLTQSAVAMGMSPGGAGVLLAGGSAAGIAGRITIGVVADRRSGPQLGLVTSMLAVGAAAMVLGAVETTPLLVAATVGVFAAGWAWSGLLFLSLVRASPQAPGAAAGVAVAGLASGNAAGPLLFGVVAEQASFATAWLAAATVAAAGAALMRLAARRLADTPTPR